MALHNDLGHEGEQMAADFLTKKGYVVLHRNWHAPRSRRELDIVCRYRGWLVVVEVKTRSSRAHGEPLDAVDWRKVQNLSRAANSYVNAFKIDLPIRFDVVGIVQTDEGVEIEHIERAFLPPVRYY